MRDWSPDRIRTVIELLGLPPSGLAAELDVTARAVEYWLSGQRKPTSAHALAGLSRLEKEAVARLVQVYQEDDPMKRDAVLKALVGAPLALTGRPFLSSAGRVLPVDERYVALMEDVTASWLSGWRLARPSELIDPVLRHYQGLMRLLDHTANGTAHRRLQVVTGKTSALMALLARDGGSWSWSKHYTNQTLDLALEARHGGLEAGALGDLAYLLSPDFGDGSRADVERSLSYAQQAYVVAKRSSPPAMRSFLVRREARQGRGGGGQRLRGAQRPGGSRALPEQRRGRRRLRRAVHRGVERGRPGAPDWGLLRGARPCRRGRALAAPCVGRGRKSLGPSQRLP